MNITIPLRHYIDIILQGDMYKHITANQATLIRNIEGYRLLCVVENDEYTTNYIGVQLGKPADGSYRLWNLKDWETSDNRRQASLRRNEELQAGWRNKVEAVIQDFINQGVKPEIARMLISKVTTTAIEGMYANITK